MEFVNSQEEKLDITCLAIVVILSPSLDHRVKHMIKDAMVFICSTYTRNREDYLGVIDKKSTELLYISKLV